MVASQIGSAGRENSPHFIRMQAEFILPGVNAPRSHLKNLNEQGLRPFLRPRFIKVSRTNINKIDFSALCAVDVSVSALSSRHRCSNASK